MLSVLVAASLALSATAIVTPLEPSPGRDFATGGTCEIVWRPDPTGTWTTTSIQLMTGSNDVMVHLTTVHTFDGTNPALTSFNWTCPPVNPHSPVYFYQFTSEASFSGVDEPQWTGRFSIGTGPIVPAPNLEGGIAWGTGALVGTAGTPAPPTAPGGSGVVTPPDNDSTTTVAPTETPGGETTPPTSPAPPTTSGDSRPATTAGTDHAMPGAGANTRTTRQSSADSTPTATPGDAAISLRGSIAALFAAVSFAATLL